MPLLSDDEVDQQLGPRAQEPVAGQLPIAPDRAHHLLLDHPLDPEPGQRPHPVAVAALPRDPLAGQTRLGGMADGPCRRDRFLLTALQ